MKSRSPGARRRKLGFDSLEARQLMASGADFYELGSRSPLYADDYFFSVADPVAPVVGDRGQLEYDLTVDAPGDQTIELFYARFVEPEVRIKVDRTASYQFEFLTYNGEGAFVVDALDAAGQSIRQVSVPYLGTSRGSANYYTFGTVTALLGAGGAALPEGTQWINIVHPPQGNYSRFGFVQDAGFTFESDRSVDQLTSQSLLAVEPQRSYALSAKAIIQDSDLNQPQLHSLGYLQLDIDRNVIEPVHTQKFGTSVDSRLASPLSPGDTSIELTSTEGWSNSSYDPSTRALAWYGYRDSTGLQYADYTYTRNVARDSADGVWARGGIQGNRIVLSKPWSGPSLPAGTAMRNAVNGEALVAALLDHAPLPSSMSATFGGHWQNGQPVMGQLAPGTRYIQPSAIVNQSAVDQDERVSVRMQLGNSDHVQVMPVQNKQRIVTLDVLANDGPGVANIISTTNGARGSVEISSDGRQLIYRPQAYFIGTDAFKYETVDQSGNSTWHEVQIKSLGYNLDSNPALQADIATNKIQQTPFQLDTIGELAGVKDQVLTSSLRVTNSHGPQYFGLEEIAFQSGSLSLEADGNYEYIPVPGEAYRFPFNFTIQTGSDSQKILINVSIAETEFRRDQWRLYNLGLAQYNFESANRTIFYPSNVARDDNGVPFLSWRVYMLPMLGMPELFAKFKLDEPWDGPTNLPLLSEMPDDFRSGSDGPLATMTRYQVLANSTYPNPLSLLLNNLDARGNVTRLNQITDGLQNQMLIVQAGADKAVPWTKPVDLAFDYTNPSASLGNVGPYFNAYFSDRVNALPSDMGNATFRALATPAGNDYVDVDTLVRAAESRADYPGNGVPQDDRIGLDQMKNLALAMHNFEATFKKFAPQTPTGGTNNLSWRVALLPFIGFTNLYNQFHLDEAWDSPHNLTVAEQMPGIYRSLGDPATSTTTRLRVLGGSGMAYGHADALKNGPKMGAFVDGTASSILMVEAGVDKAVPWTKPDVMPVDVANFWSSMGNLPNGQMLVAMADGSVRNIATSVPNSVITGLATINMGDANTTELLQTEGKAPGSSAFEVRNQLKQIGLAAHNFESALKVWPLNFSKDFNLPVPTNPNLSWRVAILPYIEQLDLYLEFHLDEPWDSPHNLSLLPRMPLLYRTGFEDQGATTTRVQRFSGPGTLDPNKRVKMSQILDGTSNSIFAAVVAPEKAVPWTKPDDIEFQPGDDWSALGNIEVTEVIMADGAVYQLRYDRELGVVDGYHHMVTAFDRLVSINDGYVIAPPGQRTLVVGESNPVAVNVTSDGPVILELLDPAMAHVAAQADGHRADIGPQQRITIEGLNDRNGKRQTQLIVKRPSSDPGQPASVVQIIDIIITDVDQPPLVAPISDVHINEDASSSEIAMVGISAGRNEQQDIAISARIVTPEIIASVSIEYQSGESQGILRFTPVAGKHGTGIIELTVADAGADGDLNTAADNGVIRRLVTVVVAEVNDAPLINTPEPVSIAEDSGIQTTIVSGIDAGPDETQPLRVTATTNSLLLSLASTNLILIGSSANLRWTPVADKFGEAVVLVQVEDGGLDNNLATTADNATNIATLTITITPKNDPPTIDQPANQLINEDTPELLVPLNGVGAGPYESGDVRLSVAATNPGLFKSLSAVPASLSSNAHLVIEPQPNVSGSTLITVRVEDAGADGDIQTTADNLVKFTSFEVVIQPVNDQPELDPIGNRTVDVGSNELTIDLTGISSGDESQPIRLTAAATTPGYVQIGSINYVAGSNSATLRLVPLITTPGTVGIEVTVEDSGLDGRLDTKADNLSVVRQFALTFNVPPEANDDHYRVLRDTSKTLNVLENDRDVEDTLRVIIERPIAASQGTLTVNPDSSVQFVAAPGFTGVVSFAYSVLDSHGRSSAATEVTIGVAGAKFQNPFNSVDVNGDGFVTAMDALLIINVLNDPNHPKSEGQYTGSDNLDTNADQNFTALDALLVINELNKG